RERWICSRGPPGLPKKRRKIGSSSSGLGVSTSLAAETLDTAGGTRLPDGPPRRRHPLHDRRIGHRELTGRGRHHPAVLGGGGERTENQHQADQRETAQTHRDSPKIAREPYKWPTAAFEGRWTTPLRRWRARPSPAGKSQAVIRPPARRADSPP